MKKFKTTLIFIMFCFSANAQFNTTFLAEAGTNDLTNKNIALMAGFTNFQDDSFHAGFLYKNYGEKSRKGIRINVNLNLSKELFLFIQSDVFANTLKEDNSSFLEKGFGLGLRITKNLSVQAGWQMEDYNPVTKIRSEDRPNVKFGYKFSL